MLCVRRYETIYANIFMQILTKKYGNPRNLLIARGDNSVPIHDAHSETFAHIFVQSNGLFHAHPLWEKGSLFALKNRTTNLLVPQKCQLL